MAAAVLKNNRWFGHIYVLLFVLFGFVLFDASSVTEALKTFKALFGAGLPPVSQEALYLLRSNAVLLILAAVGATPLPKSSQRPPDAARPVQACSACLSRWRLRRCWLSARRFWWTGRSTRSCISAFKEGRI